MCAACCLGDCRAAPYMRNNCSCFRTFQPSLYPCPSCLSQILLCSPDLSVFYPGRSTAAPLPPRPSLTSCRCRHHCWRSLPQGSHSSHTGLDPSMVSLLPCAVVLHGGGRRLRHRHHAAATKIPAAAGGAAAPIAAAAAASPISATAAAAATAETANASWIGPACACWLR